MATPESNTSLQHELLEVSDQILNLLFLSEGNATQAQLDQLSDDLTHLLRYARTLGYHAAFLWRDGEISVEWQPLGGAS